MTGPDRIWAWPWEVNPRMGQWSDAQEIVGDGNEYIRRDPAVLAALPEVQAMIAAAYEVAASVLDDECDLARIALPQAVPVLRADARAIRALLPPADLAAKIGGE